MEYIEEFLNNSFLTPIYLNIPFHTHPLFLPVICAIFYILLYISYLILSSHFCKAKVALRRRKKENFLEGAILKVKSQMEVQVNFISRRKFEF